MPQREQTEVQGGVETVLNEILNTNCPPVARCRLLSSGFNPGHALNIVEDIAGHKECLACGAASTRVRSSSGNRPDATGRSSAPRWRWKR